MYKWIWGYIKKYRFWMATGLTLSAIVAAMNVINPIITGNIVDKVIKVENRDLNLLFKLIIIMVVQLQSPFFVILIRLFLNIVHRM